MPSAAVTADISAYGWGTLSLAAGVPVRFGRLDVDVEAPEVPHAFAGRLGYAADLFDRQRVALGQWLGVASADEFGRTTVVLAAPAWAATTARQQTAAANSDRRSGSLGQTAAGRVADKVVAALDLVLPTQVEALRWA